MSYYKHTQDADGTIHSQKYSDWGNRIRDDEVMCDEGRRRNAEMDEEDMAHERRMRRLMPLVW